MSSFTRSLSDDCGVTRAKRIKLLAGSAVARSPTRAGRNSMQASRETAALLPPSHPLQPEPNYPELDLDSLNQPEPLQAQPLAQINRTSENDLVLPEVILGCAVFGLGIYNDEESILSDLPVRLVSLALRYGVNAFDTAPHYHPSEIILSRALHALKEQHPRETYRIITKAGKFGPKLAHHDYSPAAIIGSVERSLKRFAQIHPDGVEPYLDVVYLHDVEFIASNPDPAGFHLEALDPAHSAAYNLGSLHTDAKPRSLGTGDDKILAALDMLRLYQRQGKIRKVGIAGYSLPLLLRLSLLVLHQTGQPVDIIQSYGHHNLLTSTLPAFIPYFRERAQVQHIANASPFNMGILTSRGPPDWHPANQQVKQAARDVVDDLSKRGDGSVNIETLASRFGMRELRSGDQTVPVVIGVKDFEELHHAIKTYHIVRTGDGDDQKQLEQDVRQSFKDKSVADWSWQSPPADA